MTRSPPVHVVPSLTWTCHSCGVEVHTKVNYMIDLETQQLEVDLPELIECDFCEKVFLAKYEGDDDDD